MSLAMTKGEREAFLSETHVAVISVAESRRGPLIVPVWYHYQPGGVVRFVTGGSSKKARLIRVSGRLGMCVQSESPPYRYVSIEGAVTLSAPDFERDIRQMAHRYLGEQMGEMYVQMTADQRGDSVLASVTPERWLSVDYRKMALE